MIDNIPIATIFYYLFFSCGIAIQGEYFNWHEWRGRYSVKPDLVDPIIESSHILKKLCLIVSFIGVLVIPIFIFIYSTKSLWWAGFLFILSTFILPETARKLKLELEPEFFIIYILRPSFYTSPFFALMMFNSILD